MTDASFPPLVTPPSRPMAWDRATAFVVPASFGVMAGHGRARDAARSGWLKPADMDRAELSAPERVWIPLWRFETHVDGFHLGLTHVRTGDRTRVLPTGGFRHRDDVVLVLARAHLAIDPSAKARIGRADLVPLDDEIAPLGERIEPDITQHDAEEEARLRVRRAGQPQQALVAHVEVRIASSALVFLPVYVVRYRYAGEATKGATHEGHAAVSARDGTLVSSHHPPLLGSLASRLGRLFG